MASDDRGAGRPLIKAGATAGGGTPLLMMESTIASETSMSSPAAFEAQALEVCVGPLASPHEGEDLCRSAKGDLTTSATSLAVRAYQALP